MNFVFATIGRGKIVRSFLSAAAYFDSFRLEAVYSRDRHAGEIFAREYGCEKVYTSISDIAEDKKINCVYIASPNALHHDQTIALLESGKNVLCEKPLATNAREAEEMIFYAKKNGALLMEAYKTFLTPNLYQVKDHLHEIGDIRNVIFSLSKYSSKYDAHKRGEEANTFKASLGGGAMADIGVYPLYPLLILFGTPKRLVSMSLPISTHEKDFPFCDGVTTAVFDYGSLIATVNVSKISAGYSYSEIQGEKGTIRFDNINDPSKMEVVIGGDIETYALPQKKFNMYYEIKEFFYCLENGLSDPITFPNALSLEGIKIIDEIRRNSGIVYPADEAGNI